MPGNESAIVGVAWRELGMQVSILTQPTLHLTVLVLLKRHHPSYILKYIFKYIFCVHFKRTVRDILSDGSFCQYVLKPEAVRLSSKMRQPASKTRIRSWTVLKIESEGLVACPRTQL